MHIYVQYAYEYSFVSSDVCGMCMYTHRHTHMHKHIRTDRRIHVIMYLSLYVMYVCMSVCMYVVCMYVSMRVFMLVCLHMNADFSHQHTNRSNRSKSHAAQRQMQRQRQRQTQKHTGTETQLRDTACTQRQRERGCRNRKDATHRCTSKCDTSMHMIRHNAEHPRGLEAIKTFTLFGITFSDSHYTSGSHPPFPFPPVTGLLSHFAACFAVLIHVSASLSPLFDSPLTFLCLCFDSPLNLLGLSPQLRALGGRRNTQSIS